MLGGRKHCSMLMVPSVKSWWNHYSQQRIFKIWVPLKGLLVCSLNWFKIPQKLLPPKLDDSMTWWASSELMEEDEQFCTSSWSRPPATWSLSSWSGWLQRRHLQRRNCITNLSAKHGKESFILTEKWSLASGRDTGNDHSEEDHHGHHRRDAHRYLWDQNARWLITTLMKRVCKVSLNLPYLRSLDEQRMMPMPRCWWRGWAWCSGMCRTPSYGTTPASTWCMGSPSTPKGDKSYSAVELRKVNFRQLCRIICCSHLPSRIILFQHFPLSFDTRQVYCACT